MSKSFEISLSLDAETFLAFGRLSRTNLANVFRLFRDLDDGRPDLYLVLLGVAYGGTSAGEVADMAGIEPDAARRCLSTLSALGLVRSAGAVWHLVQRAPDFRL